jgi:hypothetical protein
MLLGEKKNRKLFLEVWVTMGSKAKQSSNWSSESSATYCRVLNWMSTDVWGTCCPDEGGSTYLWNVGQHSIKNKAVHPRRLSFILAAVRTWNLTKQQLFSPSFTLNVIISDLFLLLVPLKQWSFPFISPIKAMSLQHKFCDLCSSSMHTLKPFWPRPTVKELLALAGAQSICKSETRSKTLI